MDGETISCSSIEFHDRGSGTVRASMSMEAGSLVIRGMRGVPIRIEADEEDVIVKGRVLDLHATKAIKEDANGVGHTYTGKEVHYWMPLEGGSANWPAPPEHPLIGENNLTEPRP